MKKHEFHQEFAIFSTTAMAEAAHKIKSGSILRVLHTLPQHLSFEEFSYLRTVNLGAELGCGSGGVSVAMRKLHELGLVEREGRGPRTRWKLAAKLGMAGTLENWSALQAQRIR